VEVVGEMPDSIESEITQTYLVADPGCEIRLRRRNWNGKIVNVHTTKKKISGKEEIVTERQVNNSLYESLLQQADPYRQTIRKKRKSFIWQGQYFELDTYEQPQGLTILETKGIAEDETVKFPPFIHVVEDITGNKQYYNYNLALRR
jgi:CYTH domain-containing protein